MSRMILTVFSLSYCLVSCHGRKNDFDYSYVENNAATVLGLESDKSTIVVFGAGWCAPCRHEIPFLNKTKERLGENIDIVTFLVEGEVPGEPPTESDMLNFSANGEQNFTILADNDWQKFKKFMSTKKLPLILLLDDKGKMVLQHDSNLKNEEELVKLVEESLPEVHTSAEKIPAAEEKIESPVELETPVESECSDFQFPRNSDLLPFAHWQKNTCPIWLDAVTTAWDRFFESEDAEFFEASDYHLEETKFTALDLNGRLGLHVIFEKIKDGTACSLELNLFIDETFEFLNANCIPIQ